MGGEREDEEENLSSCSCNRMSSSTSSSSSSSSSSPKVNPYIASIRRLPILYRYCIDTVSVFVLVIPIQTECIGTVSIQYRYNTDTCIDTCICTCIDNLYRYKLIDTNGCIDLLYRYCIDTCIDTEVVCIEAVQVNFVSIHVSIQVSIQVSINYQYLYC